MKLRIVAALVVGAILVPASQSGQAQSSSPITEASVRAHMEFLAGDAMNGRGSGTRDEWLAATYIGAQFARFGLEPLGDNGGFVKAIETPRGEFAAPPTITAGSTKLTHGKDVLVQAVGAPHVEGPLVKFAKGVTIPAGAVVLVLGTDAPDAAAVNGAAAVLTPETDQI